MEYEAVLQGNWEERGVIGSRIEISGSDVVFLWQGGEVLKTVFTAEKHDDVIELKLKENGLRYASAQSDYASVERVFYENGRLHYIKNFPITGLSEDVMEKTDRSRYGDLRIDDTLLNKIQGKWSDKSGFTRLTIEKDRLRFDDRVIPIHAAVKAYRSYGEDFAVIAHDPAVHGIGYYSDLVYADGVLKGYILVCDVGMHEVALHHVP